jgi:CheY-like chemotaxis protein
LRPSGSAYHIHLPPVGAPAAVGPRAANTPRAILVVDDDQLLCETLSLILAGEGHHIQVAHSAEEALVLLTRVRVDAVVSDIRLPGMDGESLVEQIEARWPHLLGRTLLCSGLLAKPRREGRYLQKPFTSEQLRRALATMMAESSPKTQ